MIERKLYPGGPGQVMVNVEYADMLEQKVKDLSSKLRDAELQAASRDEQNNDLQLRLDQSQKALGIIYGLAERLPPDVEIATWLREIQEVCGQVWTDKK